MTLKGKHALVTGGSRGIGRGIALELAECGARIAVHYHVNEGAARDTLERIRKHGSDGFIVQADVSRPEDIARLFATVKQEFQTLDIFVSNARPELPTFYQAPMTITLDQWDMALNSQARAFLIGVREAAALMGEGGRIVAVTYAPGARTGSWQPWVAMGSAKAAADSLVRYFAVALARRGITVNSVSPDSPTTASSTACRRRCRPLHAPGTRAAGRRWVGWGRRGKSAARWRCSARRRRRGSPGSLSTSTAAPR